MSEQPDQIRALIEEIAAGKATQIIRDELSKPENLRFEPLIDAKQLAEILGYKGARPEKGVYELVKRGGIPENCVVMVSERRMKFHPDRVRAWLGIAPASKAA